MREGKKSSKVRSLFSQFQARPLLSREIVLLLLELVSHSDPFDEGHEDVLGTRQREAASQSLHVHPFLRPSLSRGSAQITLSL
jgi:hypothetical protein